MYLITTSFVVSRARLKGRLYAELHLPECSVPLCPSQGCRPVNGYRGAVKGVGAFSESFSGDRRKPVRSLVF